MANSKYEYVRNFERNDTLLPDCHLVVRIDGHGFHRFSAAHDWRKPNDPRALSLMNRAARAVMRAFPEVTLAYGTSDEFSFLFRPGYAQFSRRAMKLVTTVVSCFTASYLLHWSSYFPTGPPTRPGLAGLALDETNRTDDSNDSTDETNDSNDTTRPKYAPTFDGRVVEYPSTRHVRDYFAWRQVDAHINNLYNTVFWALQSNVPIVPASYPASVPASTATTTTTQVDETADTHGTVGMTPAQAEERLRFTLAAEKNEILWREYGVNYNDEPAMFRKGSLLLYDELEPVSDSTPIKAAIKSSKTTTTTTTTSTTSKTKEKKRRREGVVVLHVDLIQDAFWERYPSILRD